MALLFTIHPENPQVRLLKQAARILDGGGIGAIPTDSSYALACHLDDKRAVDRIRAAMGADDVAILRAGHRANHRSAFARAGCAPVDREVVLGTRCRVRGNTNMVNSIGTSHRHGP